MVPERIYGVDFSGAAAAGKKIWIAQGDIDQEALHIVMCCRASCFTGGDTGRDVALAALRSVISSETAAVFGMDYPFSLPRVLIPERDWSSFVLAFPERYPDAQAFRYHCQESAGWRELKRVVERQVRTPFAAYNLRLYRQTYYGIRDLLYPLVRDQRVCVLPMQRPEPSKPWLFEVCPASTLKNAGLYQPYKGTGDRFERARCRILEAFEATGELLIPNAPLRQKILQDSEGDALDSVIAALVTSRHVRAPDSLRPVNGADLLEGYIYV